MNNEISDTLCLYAKLLVLLYADDTVIVCENEQDMQYALNTFYKYCNRWKLTVNVTKTQIMIFSRGRKLETPSFYQRARWPSGLRR